MLSRNLPVILAFALAGGVISCASAPPSIPNISSTADPATEIDRTQQLMNEAKKQEFDVLSPKNYAKANKELEKALKKKADGKDSKDILEHVAYSRGWLKEAQDKGQIAVLQMKGIQDARQGALDANAPALFPKDWEKASKNLEKITENIDKGNLKPADKRGDEVVQQFRDLERDSVKKVNLGKANDNIKEAEKDNAQKIAPKTYSITAMKYDNAVKIIDSNPRNEAAIKRASAEAEKESVRLVDVTNKVKAGNSEDLVLQSERQQRQISSLKRENRSAEQQVSEMSQREIELQKSQALINQAAAIRSQFKPNEAEVFTEGGRVTVRLKSLQFPTNQASLGSKNKAILKKVDTALEGIGPAKITVEGHTDNTRSEEHTSELQSH